MEQGLVANEGNDQVENEENIAAIANRIDELQEHGVNAADVSKLKAGGFHSIQALQMATKKEILDIRGITDARYESLMKAAGRISDRTSGKFKSASDLKSEMRTRYHISTGSKELDEILGGGVESASLTEVYGEYRTGKSQLCMTMCVTAQLGEKHAGKVIYVDTEGSFRPARLEPICERFGVDPTTVLENVTFARLYSTDQQEAIPFQVEALLAEEDTNYSLLIIDSIMALYRADHTGRGELALRQQRLNGHLNLLKKLSERHNLAILYTNVVMSDPSGGMTFVSDPKKAAGGHVLSHASTTRLMLRKGRDNERIAKIVDSPTQPERDAHFYLTANGVNDSD